MDFLKKIFSNQNIFLKEGDKVEMSSKNSNHLGNGICAYSGIKGKIIEVWDNGAFCIDTGTSELIVPLTKRKGVWILLNDKLIYYKKKISK